MQCAACRFVFPRSLDTSKCERADDAGPDDETWTDKWGPIRSDRYRVIRALASGAQGRILLAHHKHLDQRCVIKLVASDDEQWMEIANQRLRIEAQAGTRVNHPNVARVLDCDCVDHAWYFVMEYIDGDNLRRILQNVGRLAWQQVVDIGQQVADGLSAIHRNSLVHRDIKPSNIMLSEAGVAKIMDLGLVKLPASSGALGVTCFGQVLGTPLYMPAEQFEATEQIDGRADIYALGATLYHLLTGHPPFDGCDIEDLAEKHRRAAVVWPATDAEDVPGWLRKVVEGCLAKRREHRFQTAEAVSESLREHDETLRKVACEEVSPKCGVVVTPFQNLSRREADDWVGDAIAEYLSSQLMGFEGVHVADRHVFSRLIHQSEAGSPGDGFDPQRTQLIEAGRLVGVNHIVMGSFYRQGDDVRIIAHALCGDSLETQFLGSVSGPVAKLFSLEDLLTDKIVASFGPLLSAAGRRHESGGGTANLDAHEKYIHALRAFADGDYRRAIEYANEARELDEEYSEPLGLIGASYARLGDYERAVACHERQERWARDRNDAKELAVALSNLGAMYYYKGEYSVAYEFLGRAASMSESFDQTPDTAKLHGNLGMVQMRLGRWNEAEDHFGRAIGICKKLNDLVSMVWPYNGMGTVLLKQKRFPEAREYHERAIRLAEEVGDRVMVGVSQMNLGRCACLLNEYGEAEVWFQSALGTLERTSFWNGLTLVYEYMADMYLLENRPSDALATIEKRIELARRHGNRRMESEGWEQKARAFEEMNHTTDALTALKKSVEISQRPAPYDSLHRYLEEVTSRTAFR